MARPKYMTTGRGGYWRYKRQFKDSTWFNRGFETTSEVKAIEKWPAMNAQFEHEAASKRYAALHDMSKTVRRSKFWNAVARFLIDERRAGHGRLIKPVTRDGVPQEGPSWTQIASHLFHDLTRRFEAWAAHNDPEALEVLRLGDVNDDRLFQCGLVASFYVVDELDQIASSANIVELKVIR